MSSRNSSTRSARSSIWDPMEDRGSSTQSSCTVPGCFCSHDTRLDPLSIHSADQSGLKCPVKMCDRNIKGFARAADRKRHIFRHFRGALSCGFCTEEAVSFSQAHDRIDLFLTHLIKKHGATGEPFGWAAGKLVSLRKPSIEGPIATCSVCTEPFSAQGFYEHLPGCILREITRNEELPVEADGEDLTHINLRKNMNLSLELINETSQMIRVKESCEEGVDTGCLLPPRPSVELQEDERQDMVELTASSRCLSLTSSKAADSSEAETEWTEEQTSRESSPGISQLPRRLSPAKRRVVETVMQEFQRLLGKGLTHTTGGGSSGSSYSGNSGWSSNASIYSASSFVSRKRSLSGGGSEPPNEDDDSNKRRRPDDKVDGMEPVVEVRLACPYYKRNPGKHQTYTSCRDPGFTTVARLK